MITPLDIQNKVFKRDFRGYSMQEVDEFLNIIIEGYEKLYKENIDYRDKITLLSQSINQYRAMEQTLQNTLVVAQGAGEQVQRNASEKAENIINEAQTKAKQIINNAHEEVRKLTYKYDDIKRGVDVYRAKMISLLDSQLDMLKDVRDSDESVFQYSPIDETTEIIDEATQEVLENEPKDNIVNSDSNIVKKLLSEEMPVQEEVIETEEDIKEPQEAQ